MSSRNDLPKYALKLKNIQCYFDDSKTQIEFINTYFPDLFEPTLQEYPSSNINQLLGSLFGKNDPSKYRNLTEVVNIQAEISTKISSNYEFVFKIKKAIHQNFLHSETIDRCNIVKNNFSKYIEELQKNESLEYNNCDHNAIQIAPVSYKELISNIVQQWNEGTDEGQLNSLFWIFTGAFLGRQIDRLLTSYTSDLKQKSEPKSISLQRQVDTVSFFENSLRRFGTNVKQVDMAFHSGFKWRHTENKTDLLQYMLRKKIHLRILANTSDVVGNITLSMTQPHRKYISYEDCLHAWHELAVEYNGLIDIRTANVPLFHRTYLIRGENEGIANIKYYTYGNGYPDKDFRTSFEFGTLEYKLYCMEFDYIWNRLSKPYESSLPEY